MTKRLTLVAIITALAVAALPPAAGAVVRLGIGEQSASMFSDARFRALGVRKARIFTPWNVARLSDWRAQLDAWLAAARAARVEPFVTFTASPGSNCPARPCRLPSVRAYTRAFRAFRRRWPQVRVFAPWNEANHRSQPTFRRPRAAAAYFNTLKRRCRRCTVLAADVIDERNMVRWLRSFRRKARGERLWGLHNYRDTNPRRGQRYGGTRLLLRTVPGKVWLTETGGIVRFVLPDGRTLFPESERRANRALGRMFRLAKRHRRRVKRLYVYHWQEPFGDNRFDAGLVRASGTTRPGYRTVRRWMRTRLFAP